jgi:hypothetical protein
MGDRDAIGDGASAESIVEAYKRTAAAGPARARFAFDTGWSEAGAADLGKALPGWIRLIGKPIGALFRHATREMDMSRQVTEGVVDLANHRSAMGGEYTPPQVIIGDRMWSGRTGKYLEPADARPADTTVQPLWLLALLNGVTGARPRSDVDVGGADCREYQVTADLGRASAAIAYALATPQVADVQELSALPLTVAIDDNGVVRRVAGSDTFGETGNNSYVVELYDHGSAPAIDWEHLPDLSGTAAATA